MPSQTITNTVTHSTRNSRNARTTPGIAFGAHIPARATPKRNSDRTVEDDPRGSINGAPRDDDSDGNNEPGNEDPDDEPDNEGPDDPQDDPDDSEHGMENNLADAIAALARNVRHQEDGPRSKVREPDPFNRTDPAKLQTFLIQLWLSFNDRPRTFADDQNKVNFAISYLKGIALAHFENSFIMPNLLNLPAWDDYREFVSELKSYFESLGVVGKAESKLKNMLMKLT